MAHGAMLEASRCYRAWPSDAGHRVVVACLRERLRPRAGTLELRRAPWLMGIVIADAATRSPTASSALDARGAASSVRRAASTAGARIIDIGGGRA